MASETFGSVMSTMVAPSARQASRAAANALATDASTPSMKARGTPMRSPCMSRGAAVSMTGAT